MSKDKITVYLSYIKDVDGEAVYNKYKDSMTTERLERISRVKNDSAKKSIICTGALLATVLDKYSVYKDMIVSSSCGKPYIMGRDDLFFNISNSGDYVAIAVSESEVGVDIQKPVKASDALVKRIVATEDIFRLRETITNRFNYIFAIKEAYVKLTGEGISKDFKEITYEHCDGKLKIYDMGSFSAYCEGMVFDLDGYSLAVAAKEDFTIEIVSVNLSKR